MYVRIAGAEKCLSCHMDSHNII